MSAPLPPDFPSRIEHAVLAQEAGLAEITEACRQVRESDLRALVVNPCWVAAASASLKGSPIRLVSVCGFPSGAHRTDIKVAEAVEAVEDGAAEIDLIANIGWLVSGNLIEAEAEIRRVCRQVGTETVVKVIVEVAKLPQTSLPQVVAVVANAGARFVKTGTGLFGGATVEQVTRLKKFAPAGLGIKASGGIRTLGDCSRLLAAGADRLGSSGGPCLVTEWRARKGSAC